MKNIVLAGAMFLASVGFANAAPYTFNLSKFPGDSLDYNELSSSFSLKSGDLTATFTAGAFSNRIRETGPNRNVTPNSSRRRDGYTIGGPSHTLNPANGARIGRYIGGAGVTNSDLDDSHQVDGWGRKDFISVAFSHKGKAVDVAMSEVLFSFFNAPIEWDSFRWGYDKNGDGTYGTGDFLSRTERANPFTAFRGSKSSTYMFGAFSQYAQWKLKSITVDYTPPPVPVPVPAGGLLLLSGLGVFAFARKLKKS